MKFLRNLFFWLLIFSLVGLLGYKNHLFPYGTNTVRVRVLKDKWTFKPDTITISANKPWKILIYNEDSYPHSFFVSELGINTTLDPEKETEVDIQTSKEGEYVFSCSLICGAGHYRMNGKLIVKP